MRIRRVILWTALGAVVAAVVAAALIYGMICRVPAGYRPRYLTAEAQDEAMQQFVQHVVDFGNDAGEGRPFTWSITADQANDYLGAIDAIASLRAEEAAHVAAQMERAGFTGPAVGMGNGVLTLMIRSTRHEKIISADVAFDFDDGGDLTARIAGVRVGAMPVPQGMLSEKLAEMRRWMQEQLAGAKDQPGRVGPVRVRDLAGILRQVLEMMDGRYVRPELVWPLGKHRVLVRRIEITPGRLTLHCSPAAP